MLSAIPISNVWSLIQCEEGWKLIEAWHTLIVPTIYISGHEMLFLKKPTYWEEYDLESCYDNLKVNVLLFQNIQAGNYWIVFAHIDLINYLYKALKLLRQTQQKIR